LKRIYYHYQLWEDFLYGMYKNMTESENQAILIDAKRLLTTPKELYKMMKIVSLEWEKSTEQNLTNTSRNRQAWLGQAACCFACGASEGITKSAWNMLTKKQQNQANRIADKIIFEWEKYYKEKKGR
jgi:hypothetical protein